MDKTNLQLRHEQHIVDAWGKVCQWCKDNCTDRFPSGYLYTSYHLTRDIINDFRILEDGTAVIVRRRNSNPDPWWNITRYIRGNYVCGIDSISDASIAINSRTGVCREFETRPKKRVFYPVCDHSQTYHFDDIERLLRQWPAIKESILNALRHVDDLANFQA